MRDFNPTAPERERQARDSIQLLCHEETIGDGDGEEARQEEEAGIPWGIQAASDEELVN
jgi:hypothetical protein